MYVSKLALKQFRSYDAAEFSFDPSLTLITGRNGAGKTNLLEALYVLLQGGSFRVGDKDMIKTDMTWWRIDGLIDDEDRQVRYQLGHTPAKQLVQHETMKRFTYKDRLPVVLFEPSELQLIHGSPSRRRASLDTMLSALSSEYKVTHGRYERVLLQRNNALKRGDQGLEDKLFSWDILLSEYGTALLQARYELIKNLNTYLSGLYSYIAGTDQELTISYQSSLPHTISASQFIAGLHKTRLHDTRRGTTSIGPHRDDIEFWLRKSDAKTTASRGEVRTIVLALKIAFSKLLEKTYQKEPVILLDDVFSELDQTRQKNLLHILTNNQKFITHTQTLPDVYEISL